MLRQLILTLILLSNLIGPVARQAESVVPPYESRPVADTLLIVSAPERAKPLPLPVTMVPTTAVRDEVIVPDPVQAPIVIINPSPTWLIARSSVWRKLVDDEKVRVQKDLVKQGRWNPDYMPSTDLVLAIILQESQGLNIPTEDLSYAGNTSVGLMQVVPRTGLATADELRSPYTNVYWGLRILYGSMEIAKGDTRRAVGAYNCGFVSLDAGKCWSSGGYVYADRVMKYFQPQIEALGEG